MLGFLVAGNVFPENKKVKVLIFGQGRTGSTLLESLLVSSGYFQKNGELLGIYEKTLFSPLNFIKGYSKLRKGENFIFHAKIYHLRTLDKEFMDPEKFVKGLYQDGWKIIFLNRSNVAKQTISSQIAKARKVYHRISDQEEEFYHELDLEKFQNEVKRRLDWLEEEKEILSHIDYLEVNYERDLSDSSKHQETVDRILNFLNLPLKPVKSRIRRTSNRPLSDIISNYGEYEKLLKIKGWDHFLD